MVKKIEYCPVVHNQFKYQQGVVYVTGHVSCWYKIRLDGSTGKPPYP